MKQTRYRVSCDDPGCTTPPVEGALDLNQNPEPPTPEGWIAYSLGANGVQVHGVVCSAAHLEPIQAALGADAVAAGANDQPPA